MFNPNLIISTTGAGTNYVCTGTPSSLIVFGTTSPIAVLSAPGVFSISAKIQYSYNGATYAALPTVVASFYRTNNTAGAIGLTTQIPLNIITTLTLSGPVINLFLPNYSTTNANDSISLVTFVSATPSIGTFEVVSTITNITAVRLY